MIRTRASLLAAIAVFVSAMAYSRSPISVGRTRASARVVSPDLPAGTGELFTMTIGAWDFGQVDTLDRWVGTAIDDGLYVRACASGGCELVATLRLPSGTLIDHIELDACDEDGSADVAATLFDCVDDQSGPGTCTVMQSVATDGTPGCAFVPGNSLGANVDNLNHDYFIQVGVPPDNYVSALRAVRVYYRLQVSAPPTTATFNDVPTSDPAFQFIEAFTAAGITAGCSTSPPLFCPDATVTRRQMAVFFAKALGLNYPY